MKFLIKEISPSKKELRVTLNSAVKDGINYLMFGTIEGTFDNGTVKPKYIPTELSDFYSEGPQPSVIRALVGYLKDLIGTGGGFYDYVITLKDGTHIPIINLAVDDINLIGLDSDTIPTIVIKIINPLPDTAVILDEIIIEKQIITTQEELIYYVPEIKPKQKAVGLDYDHDMVAEIGNPDSPNLSYENYNQVSSSLVQSNKDVMDEIVSGSFINLKVDYSDFSNHVHFGSAVSKVENFKRKMQTIEGYLNDVSKSLVTTASPAIVDLRETLFTKIQAEKSAFTPYEKYLYYKAHTMGFPYRINLGENYAANRPLSDYTSLPSFDGFGAVYESSGSSFGNIDLFTGKYNVEDKPFYNNSGSFYLSFLMRGSKGITDNIVWENYNQEYIPKLPHETLYTSSILEPATTGSKWKRYIYHASMSYFVPIEGSPIGYPGGVTDFGPNSDEIDIVHTLSKTGSYAISAGGRYSNLATTVTSSGIPFTGSISPAGELFRIYANTNTNLSSSYLTDVKITKVNPINYLPFSEVEKVESDNFYNWYQKEQATASLYDTMNINSLTNNLPEYLRSDEEHITFRAFVNLMGEHYDLIKNYIDSYDLIFKKGYTEFEAPPTNILPVLSNHNSWKLMLPFGKKGSDLLDFMGSSLSSVNKGSDVKDNIWKNIINNVFHTYKSKGTHNSIRSLLNSYGFPPDILKIREHGGSTSDDDIEMLSNDPSIMVDGVSKATGNISFTQKKDKMVSYVIDSKDRRIEADWNINGVDAEAIEFVFKPKRGTAEQIVLQSSGSDDEVLWQLVLQPSASDDINARLQFKLNKTANGHDPDLSDATNRVSMSTDWYGFRNQRVWNVLLQRKTTEDYELCIAEQFKDKIRNLQRVEMNNTHTDANDNFTGIGNRDAADGGNLFIGGGDNTYGSEEYSGSIAELRVWKQALSMSIFKQHVFDRKSVVGNGIDSSRTDLIYHYRLNENWISGSSNPKIKDSNPNNIRDYSLNISQLALGHTSLYDLDEFDRIMFNSKGGGLGMDALDDNNVLIDTGRRFIDNLNPFEANTLGAFDPIVNERKASSILELTRSPQDVVNGFILNQLGNFDFNDKFTDPRDVYNSSYGDLDKFRETFIRHYDISMDVNKYIRAQADIFSKDLTKSLKRLTPARADFSKVGIELKPTYLERPKRKNYAVKLEAPDIRGEIIYKDEETIDVYREAPKPANITISSVSQSLINLEESVHKPHLGSVAIKPGDWDTYNREEYNFTNFFGNQGTERNIELSISNSSGSVININEELFINPGGNLKISTGTDLRDDNVVTLTQQKINPYEVDIGYGIGDETMNDRFTKEFTAIESNWGSGINDRHFYSIYSYGASGDGNVYHYDARDLFITIGDVETLSASYNADATGKLVAYQHTDFTGTITNGVYTASKDFLNQRNITLSPSLGARPLGSTLEFKPSSSFTHKGKFLDEVFVYPSNHEYMVGSSKDTLDEVYFRGTQNNGGTSFESEVFDDLSADAFYTITSTGENTLEVNYGQ